MKKSEMLNKFIRYTKLCHFSSTSSFKRRGEMEMAGTYVKSAREKSFLWQTCRRAHRPISKGCLSKNLPSNTSWEGKTVWINECLEEWWKQRSSSEVRMDPQSDGAEQKLEQEQLSFVGLSCLSLTHLGPAGCKPWHCSLFPTQVNTMLVHLLAGNTLWLRLIKIQKCLTPLVNKMPLKICCGILIFSFFLISEISYCT